VEFNSLHIFLHFFSYFRILFLKDN